jgi:hypothetical protein
MPYSNQRGNGKHFNREAHPGKFQQVKSAHYSIDKCQINGVIVNAPGATHDIL